MPQTVPCAFCAAIGEHDEACAAYRSEAEQAFARHQKGIDALEQLGRDMVRKGTYPRAGYKHRQQAEEYAARRRRMSR